MYTVVYTITYGIEDGIGKVTNANLCIYVLPDLSGNNTLVFMLEIQLCKRGHSRL